MTEQQRSKVISDNPEYIPEHSPPNYVDLTGKDYPGFKILYRVKDRSKWKVSYLCECKCDEHNLFIATANNIQSGNTNSCGCYGKQKIIEASKKYNKYDLSGEYGIGWASNNNMKFYFDLEDYNKIKNYCWYYSKRGYIESRINGKLIKLHRIIMNIDDPDIKIDHIFHDENGKPRTYDNRKSNLRVCTQQENCCNSKIRSDNTTGIAGVEFDKRRNVYQASIKYQGQDYYLGAYKNIDDAINVRRQKEGELFKEFQYKEYTDNV